MDLLCGIDRVCFYENPKMRSTLAHDRSEYSLPRTGRAGVKNGPYDEQGLYKTLNAPIPHANPPQTQGSIPLVRGNLCNKLRPAARP